MPRKDKKKKNHIEVEQVKKLPHCLGKKCSRFAMFRESCPENSCFHINSAEQKKELIEELIEILPKIQKE